MAWDKDVRKVQIKNTFFRWFNETGSIDVVVNKLVDEEEEMIKDLTIELESDVKQQIRRETIEEVVGKLIDM